MSLTEEQIAHFYREGYVVVPQLISQEAVQAVMKAANQSRKKASNGRWQATIFDHTNPTKDAPLHCLLVEPSLVSAVESIFESAPRVYYGMLAVVTANGGNGLPWHQDNQYDTVLGGALNAFIALSDITPDKAILWVAPRSHLSGVQVSKDATDGSGHREAVVEPLNGQPLPMMRSGDVCIFDRNTYHRNLKNETDEDRYAYAAQYQSDLARSATTGAKDPLKLRAADLHALWQKEGSLG